MTSDIDTRVHQYEKANPAVQIEVAGRKIVYATPNTTCLQRVQTLATKEPDTLGWLDSMPNGGVLLDVGANVGMYTVYAAVVRAARVYAFEPESQNYGILCRNIALNNLGEQVVAWSAALSDEQKFDRIHLSNFTVGGSCHSFGETLDPFLKQRDFPFSQGCYSTTIDTLVADGVIPAPNFIKIDVDGLEHKVIAGAARTLKKPAVTSILVELNSHVPEHMAVIGLLSAMGFSHSDGQFRGAQRTQGYFKGVGECIFRR